MEWICGVSYTTTGFCLRTIDGNQDEHVRPVKELQSVLANNGNLTKIRGNTSFADWRELSTAETDDLAKELGFPTGCNGQTFYEFKVEGERYIIPAGVLMCAMFRPFHGIAKYLFAPQGLDNLCIPYGNCEQPELLFFVGVRGTTGIQTKKAQGILNSLSWIHCFPSARKMWCSVLEQTSQARLNLRLPSGAIQFTGSGRLLKHEAILISEFRIKLLKTQELPFESYSRHTSVIEFERIAQKPEKPKQGCELKKDSSIPVRESNWEVTDDEWLALENILVIRRNYATTERARRFLNLILHKLSQGLSWADVTDSPLEVRECSMCLFRIKADGRWEKIIAKLNELRT